MAIQIVGNSGTVAEVDSNRNLLVYPGYPAFPAAGGWYSATGYSGTTGVVAAALAANTSLMSFRLSASSTRKAYVDRLRVSFTPATVGASGGVAGVLGLQRFTTATPTGGTARTAARKNAALGTASDVTDIRDSNAALTVTSVVFGDVVASTVVPLFTTGGSAEWVAEIDNPLVLAAGDGLVLRTQVAMAATQTWQYTYNIYWHEF